MDIEEYLVSRVDDQIQWYSKKSSFNKWVYTILQTIEIVLAALIPFFSGFASNMNWASITIGALGVSITIIGSLTKLYKFHENWIHYRSTSEILKYQKHLYITQSAPYNSSDETIFNLFVRNIEQIVSSENNQWKTTNSQIEQSNETKTDSE